MGCLDLMVFIVGIMCFDWSCSFFILVSEDNIYFGLLRNYWSGLVCQAYLFLLTRSKYSPVMKHLPVLFTILAFAGKLWASPPTTTDLIKIDQFGYRPGDQKIAVISQPQTGYNAPVTYVPGTSFEVRDWNTDAVVFTGAPAAWNGGTTQAQSGDKVWWFDFSSFATPGSYYVYDVTNALGSYRFEIDSCVYNDVLKHAVRMYFYQRCGFAKTAANAGTGWADAACHLGTQQDTDCRLVSNTSASTSKDLSGGWHDAGDHNKYVNWTFSTLTDLLLAYQESPSVWQDDYNIPESNNGIPDLLDEVKWEMDWLLRMQNSDGSMLGKVAVTTSASGSISPPSSDVNVRRYSNKSTSASYSAAAIFALAAIQYNSVGMTAYAQTLQTASVNAYNWAVANPGVVASNTGLANPDPELGTYDTDMRHLAAAVYLYALTGTASYKTYFDNNYTNAHMMQWTYAYPFETPYQDMLLYYNRCSSPTASVLNNINTTYSNSMSANNADNLPAYTNQADAYRAYLADNNYTWGSNTTKGNQGSMFMTMNVYGLNSSNAANYANAASGFVHYFHGVNPNAKTYLSNMGAYGAENPVSQIYHGWFEDGSALWDEAGVSTYGPAPGYVPGGPNPSYDWDGCCPGNCGSPQNNAMCYSESISPPKNQPIQKSWKDFNTSWPINSWTITEPAIYSQAAYVRMLSKFCSNCSVTTSVPVSKNDLRLSVYPSPAQDAVNISFAGFPENVFSLDVVNVSGQVMLSKKIVLAGNSKVESIDVSLLPAGVYFFSINTGSEMITKKIVKL